MNFGGEFPQQGFRGVPIDTGIGYGDTVSDFIQVIRDRLVTGLEITLQHYADNGPVAVLNLSSHIVHDGLLICRILSRIAMTAIDHDVVIQSGFYQLLLTGGHAFAGRSGNV